MNEAQALTAIFKAMDYKEWSADTNAEVAEILADAGYNLHAPREGRRYWGNSVDGGVEYAAEYIDEVRICAWDKGHSTFGLQVWNQKIKGERIDGVWSDGFTTIEVSCGDWFTLDDMLDKGIEVYQRIRA